MVPLRERADQFHLIDNGQVRILGPDAKEILARRGIDPDTLKPVRGAQNTGGIPPLPAKLSQSDVGKPYINKDGQPIKVLGVREVNGKVQMKFEPFNPAQAQAPAAAPESPVIAPTAPAPAAPSPAPAAGGGRGGRGGVQAQPKTFPRAKLAAYGQANGGKTPEQAEAYLKSQGYIIQ
jgi:hypothetical protein